MHGGQTSIRAREQQERCRRAAAGARRGGAASPPTPDKASAEGLQKEIWAAPAHQGGAVML